VYSKHSRESQHVTIIFCCTKLPDVQGSLLLHSVFLALKVLRKSAYEDGYLMENNSMPQAI